MINKTVINCRHIAKIQRMDTGLSACLGRGQQCCSYIGNNTVVSLSTLCKTPGTEIDSVLIGDTFHLIFGSGKVSWLSKNLVSQMHTLATKLSEVVSSC